MNSNHLLDIIGDAKDQHILSAIKTREMVPQRHSLNKALLIAIAATLILVTMTGAAVYTRWSKSMNSAYQASQTQREQAQDVGLSTMLEKEKKSDDILSVTDQGITVTAVQTVADDYHMKIVFRIEGFSFPEGMPPFAFPILDETLDGLPLDDAVTCSYGSGGYFYDGTVMTDDRKTVYADGTPIQQDANGDWILHYQAEDGSMEYILEYTFTEPGRHLGKVIETGFTAFGHSTGKAAVEKDVVGNWRLRWKITGSGETYKATLDAPLGDSGDVVKEIEITPMSIGAVVQTKDYFDSDTSLGDYPRWIAGLRMKDGSTMTLVSPSSSGYQDEANTLYRMRSRAYRLYNVEDVEAVLFHSAFGKYPSGDDRDKYFEVPIR